MKKLIAALIIIALSISFIQAENSPSNYRILINTASRTLKLFQNDALVKEFPIAVGKPSTKSPLGSFKIVNKAVNPWWNNHGNPVPPGPKNPLGVRWMGISAPRGTYGIHGNSTPSSIGTFASGGCIRMFNSDVEGLFSIVSIGTPVKIVYENLELKTDKYTNTAVLIVYPDVYKKKTAAALLNNLRKENNNISEEQGTKALKLAGSSITKTTAVSEGTPFLFNNQFITNDAFLENDQIYLYYLAALDYFGLDAETVAELELKTLEKNSRIYINMTDAISKTGGTLQYDKSNNNIYLTASLVIVNGKFLTSYSGGFDKEYSFNQTMLMGIDSDIIPATGTKQIVNLKDYVKKKNWKLIPDSLLQTMHIEIPLRIKIGDKYISTEDYNNRPYIKAEDAKLIPEIEKQIINYYDFAGQKYIDLYELMEAYEYKKDNFFTTVELIKPLNLSNENDAETIIDID